MIDIILIARFVHLIAAAVMFGGWLIIAALLWFAYRSRQVSVIAVVSQFVIRIELFVMAAAMALQPISGFALGAVVGLSSADTSWIDISAVVYAVVLACWIAAVVIEFRVNKIARAAALERLPLGEDHRWLFRGWLMLAPLIIAGTIALFVLMVWQPRFN